MSDPNELSEEEKKKLGSFPVFTAKVVVKGEEEIKRLEKELEAERIEKEDLASKLEMIAEKQFEKAKKDLGAPDYIETPEQLEAFKAEKEKHKQPAMGKARWENEPSSQLSNVKEYASVSEMMEDLRQRAQSSNKAVAEEAEEILAKLHEKMQNEKKSHNFEFELDIGKIGKEKREKGAKIYEEITKNSRGNQA